MRLSSRLASDLTPGRLQRALDGLRAVGAPLVDLTCSNPPACGLGPTVELLARALADAAEAGYHPEPRGLPGARRAVARYYTERGMPTTADSIFLSASTSQSYSELIKLFADPADEILVPQPSYPLFDMLVELEGCRPVAIPSSFATEDRWQIDMAALEHAFTPRTRAVVLVSPNNPTGAYLTPEQHATIQRLCGERGCPLLLDEVFYDYPTDGVRAPLLGEGNGLTVRLSGLSKVVGAPQSKLGWIRLGGDEELVHAAADRLEFIADAYLSASIPAQLAAEVLLPARGPVQVGILERLQTNQHTVERAFGSGSPARLLPRQGGWYVVLQLPEGEDEEQLAYELLLKDQVVVHPGYFYDFPEGEHLVISLIPTPDEFAEGVRRAAARVEARFQVHGDEAH